MPTEGPFLTEAQIEQLWIANGGPTASAQIAAAIAEAESSGGEKSYNVNTDGSTDRGIWQINSVHGSQSTFDPNANAKAAIAISQNGTDWKPWTTYTSGAYQKFLSNAPLTSTGSVTSGSQATPATATQASYSTDPVMDLLSGLGFTTGIKDILERLGLILIGSLFIIIGVWRFTDVGRSVGNTVVKKVNPL